MWSTHTPHLITLHIYKEITAISRTSSTRLDRICSYNHRSARAMHLSHTRDSCFQLPHRNRGTLYNINVSPCVLLCASIRENIKILSIHVSIAFTADQQFISGDNEGDRSHLHPHTVHFLGSIIQEVQRLLQNYTAPTKLRRVANAHRPQIA